MDDACHQCVGVAVLGILLEALARSGVDGGMAPDRAPWFGTGVLGGFTTYSTLAVETVGRLAPESVLIGVAYALGSVVLGVSAAAVGYRLAQRIG